MPSASTEQAKLRLSVHNRDGIASAQPHACVQWWGTMAGSAHDTQDVNVKCGAVGRFAGVFVMSLLECADRVSKCRLLLDKSA